VVSYKIVYHNLRFIFSHMITIYKYMQKLELESIYKQMSFIIIKY